MNNILTGTKSIHCDTLQAMNNILTGTKSIHCDKPQADYEQYTDRHIIYTLTRCEQHIFGISLL